MNETKTLTTKELRVKGRKKCWSPSQRFWMEVSLYLTTPFLRTSITPNMITVTWIILEIFAFYLFTLGEYWINVLAVILFNFIALIGDHIDGNLARMKEKFSLLGPYLEQLGIFFGTPLIFLGLAIGNYFRYQNFLFLIISLVGVLFWLFEKIIRINPVWFSERQEEIVKKFYVKASFRSASKTRIFFEIFRRGQPFYFLFFCVVFDYTQLASLVYSFLFLFEFCRKLYINIKNLNKKV